MSVAMRVMLSASSYQERSCSADDSYGQILHCRQSASLPLSPPLFLSFSLSPQSIPSSFRPLSIPLRLPLSAPSFPFTLTHFSRSSLPLRLFLSPSLSCFPPLPLSLPASCSEELIPLHIVNVGHALLIMTVLNNPCKLLLHFFPADFKGKNVPERLKHKPRLCCRHSVSIICILQVAYPF